MVKCICVFLFFVLPHCLAAAQTNGPARQRDSLRTVIANAAGEDKLNAYEELKMWLYYNETDPAPLLKVLADYECEALRQGNEGKAAAVRANTVQVLYERNLFGELVERADDDLKFLADRREWKLYFTAFSNVVSALFRDGQRDRAFEEAARCTEEAERIGTPFARANSLYLTGLLHGWNSRADASLKYFAEAMRAAGDDPECDPLKLLIYGYSMQAMFNEENMEELKTLLADWEAEIARQHAAGTNVRASQINLYGGYARYYMGTQEWDRMEEYCALLERLYNHPDGLNILNQFRTVAAMARRDWDRALEHIDALYRYAERTDNQADKFSAMRERTRVMISSGRWDDALASLDRTLELRDSISDMEFNARLDELRTQYEVDRHIADSKRNRDYFLFALAACVLLAAALGIWIHYNRRIARKNRVLARQIHDLTAQQELREAELLAKTTFTPELKAMADAAATPDDDDGLCTESRRDRLCLAIRDIILREKAYRNPTFSRDYVIDRLETNRKSFSDAFYSCFGMIFTDYINSLRLKEAVKLLDESGLSIEDIARSTGFGTIRTFQRQFHKAYDLSPTDYRDSKRTEFP